MRRKDKLVTDSSMIKDVIDHADVCRLALVDGNRPYIVPMNFGYDGSYFYLHSATSGKKTELLKKNQYVCLEFEQGVTIKKSDQPCNWSCDYFTVVVHGEASEIEDTTQKNSGLAMIVSHYDQGNSVYTFTEEQLKSVVVYQIKPYEIIGKLSGMKDQ